ncbi:uncharacterized protein J3R85_011272 [Psidium guajava]|nr:uncharacterized protein J3R85_011272 [Psidium guajava]
MADWGPLLPSKPQSPASEKGKPCFRSSCSFVPNRDLLETERSGKCLVFLVVGSWGGFWERSYFGSVGDVLVVD